MSYADRKKLDKEIVAAYRLLNDAQTSNEELIQVVADTYNVTVNRVILALVNEGIYTKPEPERKTQ